MKQSSDQDYHDSSLHELQMIFSTSKAMSEQLEAVLRSDSTELLQGASSEWPLQES